MKKVLIVVAVALSVSLTFPVTHAVAAEPIVIGVATALTSLEGRESLNTIKMAVEEINSKGGVKVGNVKRPFIIETADTRDASAGVPVQEALLALEKIITEKKVKAIIVGPFRSEALLAGMDIIAKYKVPLLGAMAMSPKSEGRVIKEPDKYKYVFRVCLNAKYLVGYLVKTLGFLKAQFGFDKLFVMHQDVLWARMTGTITSKVAVGKLKWKNVGIQAYPTGSKDFSAGLQKAKAVGAQVIIPIFDMPESGILLKQWQAMKIPSLPFGFISPMAGPGAWERFDKKLGGLMNTNFEIGSGIATKKYAPAKEFYDKYTKKYGKPLEAGHGPAPAYDAVYILAAAIERAGSLDPDKLVDALKKTDRQGVIGKIKFGDGNQVIYGDDPTKTAVGCVSQWTKDGKRVVVFPKSLAEGKIQLPPWMKATKK